MKKSKPAKRQVFAFDVDVGAKIREARLEKKITQTALAQYVGVTFQAVQRYERGVVRLPLFRLVAISGMLGYPVMWFLEGVEP